MFMPLPPDQPQKISAVETGICRTGDLECRIEQANDVLEGIRMVFNPVPNPPSDQYIALPTIPSRTELFPPSVSQEPTLSMPTIRSTRI